MFLLPSLSLQKPIQRSLKAKRMVRMSLQACCSSLALNHQWCLVTLKQNKMQGIFINVILLVLHVKNQLYFILKFKTWKWEHSMPLIMSNTKLCYIRDETKEVFLLSYHITINVMKSYRKYHKIHIDAFFFNGITWTATIIRNMIFLW